jgi:hypothetical protein
MTPELIGELADEYSIEHIRGRFPPPIGNGVVKISGASELVAFRHSAAKS